MTRLLDALRAWDTDAFAATLKRQIEALGAGPLPMGEAAGHGGLVEDGSLAATVLTAREDATGIEARVGVFFTEVFAGCSCGEGPMPMDAYCTLRVRIDKASGQASFSVVADGD